MPHDRNFQIAAARAEATGPVEFWFCLNASQRAASIYRELRELDRQTAERLALTPQVSGPGALPVK